MTPEDKERWNRLVAAAQHGASDGTQAVPLDLLIAVDLELCALERLCEFRRSRPSADDR